MTLNDINGVMAVNVRYSTEFESFAVNYVNVVEDTPIVSAKM